MGQSDMIRMMAGNMPIRALGFVAVLIMTVLSLSALAALAGYICRSTGLYVMAKRESIPHPWMAFVPVLQRYLQGELCGDINFGKKTLRDTGIWLAVIPFLYTFVIQIVFAVAVLTGMGMGFSYMGMNGNGRIAGSLGFSVTVLLAAAAVIGALALTAVYRVLFVLVNQRIFGRYTSETMKTVHAVLSALIPLYESIAFFVMRNQSYYETVQMPEQAAEEETVQMSEQPAMEEESLQMPEQPATEEESLQMPEQPATEISVQTEDETEHSEEK